MAEETLTTTGAAKTMPVLPAWLAQTLRVLIIVAIPVALVMTNVRLMLTDFYVNYEYNKASFPPDIMGLWTTEDRLTYSKLALNYLLNDAGIEFLGEQVFPDGATYTGRELGHMLDVKIVVQWTLRAGYAALLIAVVGSLLLAWPPETRPIARSALMIGSGILLAILLALLAYIALNFNAFFTQFHNVFFAEGTWMFRLDDVLIRMFPLQFWSDIFTLIGGLSIVQALLILGLSWRFLR